MNNVEGNGRSLAFSDDVFFGASRQSSRPGASATELQDPTHRTELQDPTHHRTELNLLMEETKVDFTAELLSG